MKRLLITLIFLFIPLFTHAEVSVWKIIPEKSSLTFTATQNNSPILGEFKKWNGEIHFDPTQLANSHIHIIIDISSVTTSYKEVENTLKTPDWFNSKVFPQAIFDAKHFIKRDNNHYEANGTLTLRDKTLPIKLTFNFDDYSANTAHAKGNASLKRTQFGVGQGEWSSTSEIKDEVAINFVVTAVK